MPVASFRCTVKQMMESLFRLLPCIVPNWMCRLIAEFFQTVDESKCIETLQSGSVVLRSWIMALREWSVLKIPVESVSDWRSCFVDFRATSVGLFDFGL